MDDQIIIGMFNDMFKAIDETQELLDSFPPDYVKEKTSTPPSRLVAELIFKEFLDKEQIDA